MRTMILCGDKIVGTAVKTATGSVTYVTSPSKFDDPATLAEAAAFCAEFSAKEYGRPIYAKPAAECRYNLA